MLTRGWYAFIIYYENWNQNSSEFKLIAKIYQFCSIGTYFAKKFAKAWVIISRTHSATEKSNNIQ